MYWKLHSNLRFSSFRYNHKPRTSTTFFKLSELSYERIEVEQKVTAKRKLERLQFSTLHHRLSKFEVPVVVNLKHILELFGLIPLAF